MTFDPVLIGLLSTIVFGTLLSLPLFAFYFHARSNTKSTFWRAVYTPRTWWPRESTDRAHHADQPGPSDIWALFLGSAPRAKSQFLDDDTRRLRTPSPAFLTRASHQILSDEELHLRFLGLCLRLAVLGAVIALPLFLPLFMVGVPKLLDRQKASVLDDLTALRLLIAFDTDAGAGVSGLSAEIRLIVWTASAIVFGTLVSGFLIFREWRFLVSHLRLFREQLCGGLEMVFLPSHGKGWKGVGEKAMVEWVRACALGPEGAQGGGEAVRRSKQRGEKPRRSRAATLSSPDRGPDYTNIEEAGSHDHARDLMINGVFTITSLSTLNSIARQRRKALGNLELAEAHYISAFVPVASREHSGSSGGTGRATQGSVASPWLPSIGHKKSQRRGGNNEPPMTPYGPAGQYSLGQRPRLLSLGWAKSRWSTVGIGGGNGGLGDAIGRRLVGASFSEVEQDLHLTNSNYMDKWKVGNRVRVDETGRLQSLAPGQPSPGPNNMLFPSPTAHYYGEDSLQQAERHPMTAISPREPRRSDSRDTMAIDPYTASSNTVTFQDSHPLPSSGVTTPLSPFASPSLEPGFAPRKGSRHDMAEMSRSLLSPASTGFSENRNVARGSMQHSPKDVITEEPGSIPSSPREISHARDGALDIPQPQYPRPSTESFPLAGRAVAARPIDASASSSVLPQRPDETVFQPALRPSSFVKVDDLGELYNSIRLYRSELKKLSRDFVAEKTRVMSNMEDGVGVKGWILVGRGVGSIRGVKKLDGMTKDDIQWDLLAASGGRSRVQFWLAIGMIALLASAFIFPIAALSMAASPGVSDTVALFRPIVEAGGIPLGLTVVLIPVILVALLSTACLILVRLAIKSCGLPSRAASQTLALKATCAITTTIFVVWFGMVTSFVDAAHQVDTRIGITNQLANGSIITSTFFISISSLVALLLPAFVLAQPIHARRIAASLSSTCTPRRRFQDLIPITLNRRISAGAGLIVIITSTAFTAIAPLTIPPACLLAFLLLWIQRRHVTFLYRRSSQTGGVLEITLVKVLVVALCFQNLLLGLLLLSRSRWGLAGAAFGAAIIVGLGAAIYASKTERRKSRASFSPASLDALRAFEAGPITGDDPTSSENEQSSGTNLSRRSMASILELLDAALLPPQARLPRQIPLRTENIDDIVETRLAARTHPDAAPHLPDLPWTEEEEVAQESLYPPVLLQDEDAAVWLPKEPLASEEARHMDKYWSLKALYDESISAEGLNFGRKM